MLHLSLIMLTSSSLTTLFWAICIAFMCFDFSVFICHSDLVHDLESAPHLRHPNATNTSPSLSFKIWLEFLLIANSLWCRAFSNPFFLRSDLPNSEFWTALP